MEAPAGEEEVGSCFYSSDSGDSTIYDQRSNLNPVTITVCRKIAKRSEAWYNDPEMPPPHR
jgi:hypothetical protein